MTIHLGDMLKAFDMEDILDLTNVECPKCKHKDNYEKEIFISMAFCERKKYLLDCKKCHTKLKRGYLYRNYAKNQEIKNYYIKIYNK